MGDVVLVGLVGLGGDVGVVAATVDVGIVAGGTGGRAAFAGVVVVTPVDSGLESASAAVGFVVEAAGGKVEPVAVVSVGSALAADVSAIEVDGA
jgi:hypothetical protein